MAAKKEYCNPAAIGEMQFFHDNDRIAFKHCCPYECCPYKFDEIRPCLWSVYELSTKKLYEFTVFNKVTPHRLKSDVSFSRDGKQIVFVSGDHMHRNIFIMDADSGNVRQLTHHYNENPQDAGNGLVRMTFNAKPSFSPDGKRIIFVRSQTKRRQYMNHINPAKTDTWPSRWDVYEMEIATGKERQLTNYAFYSISAPQYLSDGKRFVFSTDVSGSAASDSAESGIDSNNIGKYWGKYLFNAIFIMDGENNTLKPILKNGGLSEDPRVLSDDAILFRSWVNLWDNEVWTGPKAWAGAVRKAGGTSPFIYRKGEIKRIYNKIETNASSYYSTSPDGTRVLLEIYGAKRQVLNTEGALLAEIDPHRGLAEIDGRMDEWYIYFNHKRIREPITEGR
jgi:hypothetical protein